MLTSGFIARKGETMMYKMFSADGIPDDDPMPIFPAAEPRPSGIYCMGSSARGEVGDHQAVAERGQESLTSTGISCGPRLPSQNFPPGAPSPDPRYSDQRAVDENQPTISGAVYSEPTAGVLRPCA